MVLTRMMATHHTGFLELMDRIIVLEEGKCVLEGRSNPPAMQAKLSLQNKCSIFYKCFLEDISIVFPMDRYVDVKDSSEFQRYTSSCQTHKEADEGMEEVGKKEMREMEVKEEEEVVEEEKRQHGRVRIHQNQILKSISYIHPPDGIYIYPTRWRLRITPTM